MTRGAGTTLGCDRRPPGAVGWLFELIPVAVPASALELALQVLIEGLALDLFLRQAKAAPGTGRTRLLGEQVILGIRDVDWPEFIWATDPRGRSDAAIDAERLLARWPDLAKSRRSAVGG